MKRVCVIGAGPSGLSTLHWLSKLFPEVQLVCYEKQSQIGGIWNYTWRTGLDEYGEPVHGSMYKYLWSNGPKEALEFPDYTFMDHFGKPIGSFPPREVLFDYLKGRFATSKCEEKILFEHVVRNVKYDNGADVFHVEVKDLKKNVGLPKEKFDYVIVCTSHFSFPNVPDFPGLSTFKGRILHSHDFRDASEFKDQHVFIIGSSYSAEDLALQTWKYGAKKVTISYRTNPMDFHWPQGIEERPLLKKITDGVLKLRDGSDLNDVDAIILCTGYIHHYPFLEERLTLKGNNVLYPDNLIKGIVWHGAGNNKLLYIGAADLYYSFTLFDVQAYWAAKYIGGKITIGQEDVEDMKNWVKRCQALKTYTEDIEFQTEYVVDVAKSSGFPYDLNVAQMFHSWEEHKHDDILTYRDKVFTSKFTNNEAAKPTLPWTKNMDDSLNGYLK